MSSKGDWMCPLCWKPLYSRKAWRHHVSVKHHREDRDRYRENYERMSANGSGLYRGMATGEWSDLPSEDELRFATDPAYREQVEKDADAAAQRLQEMLKELGSE